MKPHKKHVTLDKNAWADIWLVLRKRIELGNHFNHPQKGPARYWRFKPEYGSHDAAMQRFLEEMRKQGLMTNAHNESHINYVMRQRKLYRPGGVAKKIKPPMVKQGALMNDQNPQIVAAILKIVDEQKKQGELIERLSNYIFGPEPISD